MVIHVLTLLLAQSMFSGLPIDGISCDPGESFVQHIHASLHLSNHGRELQIPQGIGIPQGGNCLYWLHTHAPDGMIHIESPKKTTFTLGQFFDIWGAPLSRAVAAGVRAPRGRTLRVTVNGKAWKSDPRAIPLRDHEDIRISNS